MPQAVDLDMVNAKTAIPEAGGELDAGLWCARAQEYVKMEFKK